MVTESKYTSPLPCKVAHTLALNEIAIASDTGTSMPKRKRRRSRQADVKNTRAEYRTTGVVMTKLIQRKKSRICVSMSDTAPMYIATAIIMTCIMPKPATAIRRNAADFSCFCSDSKRLVSNGWA